MTKKEAAAAALVGMIDELGDLEQVVQPYRAKIARAEALRSAIRAAVKADPETSVTLDGERWRALLGPAGNQSTVDVAALYKLLGPQKFAAIASVTVSALRSGVGDDVRAAVVSTQPTGPRGLTLVPIE